MNNIPNGVSMENASYIENKDDQLNVDLNLEKDFIEEHTPQLFESNNKTEIDNNLSESEIKDEHTEKLFDQDLNEEDEDFEIPAFLRKQKF